MDELTEFVFRCLIEPFTKEISAGVARKLTTNLETGRATSRTTATGKNLERPPSPYAKNFQGHVPITSPTFITDFVYYANGWIYIAGIHDQGVAATATQDGVTWYKKIIPPEASRYGYVFRTAYDAYFLKSDHHTWRLPDKINWGSQ